MMTSKPVNTDSDNDTGIVAAGEASYSVEEVTTPSQTLSEQNGNSLEAEKEDEDKAAARIELPEPDAENITVLTHKLPNKPILPWNRYDSPWQESEAEVKGTDENEEKSEPLSASSSEGEQEETRIKTDEEE